MTIPVTMYDTTTLLGVFRFFIDSQTYWLDNFFTGEVHSDNEYIDFEKISDVRRIAPLVAPLAQGKPIYTEGGAVTRVKPSYSKMKDPVGPTRTFRRRPGELANPDTTTNNILARWNSLVADISGAHKNALSRLWEWMAARATIDATITIYGEAMPERTVAFGRDAGQTVVLTGGARWGQSGVSIMSMVNSWKATMRLAQFGGAPSRITMAPNVWEIVRVDAEIRALMSTQIAYAGSRPDIILGIRDNVPGVDYVGSLDANLPIFVYNDFYHAYDGTVTPYMGASDVVLTGPGINGVRCFGAIADPNANFQPLSIYPRMYLENDPPAAMILTQSSPLMVPVNPNATFKATVI